MEDGQRNALIESTFLGIEDHGLLVFTVTLDYGDSGQGFNRIIGSETVNRSIAPILQAVGVDSWEKLTGKSCRALVSGGLIRQIGHFYKETWTNFDWE